MTNRESATARGSRLAVRSIFLVCVVMLPLSQAATAQIRDVEGRVLTPFATRKTANALIFVASDCPISNGYAPEIQRLCAEYAKKGISCLLVYEDVNIDAASVRRHLQEYRYKSVPAVIDRDRAIASRARASVTPQAVVVGPGGQIEYRGRIDNKYEELGTPRRVVTSRDLRDALDALLGGRAVSMTETPAVGCHIVPPDVLRKTP